MFLKNVFAKDCKKVFTCLLSPPSGLFSVSEAICLTYTTRIITKQQQHTVLKKYVS